jgi:hypothetical protein
MTALILFVGGLTLLAVLSLLFGADSRKLDQASNAWW